MSTDHTPCKDNHEEFKKFRDDISNPKDGVLACMRIKQEKSIERIYNEIGKKMGVRITLWLMATVIGLMVTVVGASVTYSLAQANENTKNHRQLVTRAELDQRLAAVKEDVNEIKLDQKAIIKQMTSDKQAILNAIRNIK